MDATTFTRTNAAVPLIASCCTADIPTATVITTPGSTSIVTPTIPRTLAWAK